MRGDVGGFILVGTDRRRSGGAGKGAGALRETLKCGEEKRKAGGVRRHCSLIPLVQYCRVEEEGAMALARALEHNYSITALNLRVCVEEGKMTAHERTDFVRY